MKGAGTEEDKWKQTGWKIEQKYANKVLVGNWAEERLRFTQQPTTANSTTREDYQPHWDLKPDVSERRWAPMSAKGLPSKLLFAADGPPPSHYSVTLYGESYGRRDDDALPTLRPCHPRSSPWQLERSEQPVCANSGVPQSTERLPPLTVYRSTYPRHPLSAFCQIRSARMSRQLSSHLHAANRNNKDLDLRRRPLLQIPDHYFSLSPQKQQANRENCFI